VYGWSSQNVTDSGSGTIYTDLVQGKHLPVIPGEAAQFTFISLPRHSLQKTSQSITKPNTLGNFKKFEVMYLLNRSKIEYHLPDLLFIAVSAALAA
jgi:hypothetical protein